MLNTGFPRTIRPIALGKAIFILKRIALDIFFLVSWYFLLVCELTILGIMDPPKELEMAIGTLINSL